ncbi:hypothetical protein LEP1GSC059_1960 [Leptospira noguchii serovar Panama str. CZ214]|uniref:Uncharacterized protein n=1 Tax=Leptospira noguchii serovar Panama str. CZ214 TaxID=1001595 RepID=T0FKB8_9LEPT|nr:hypothetical protein LEP1GSC059_1960 [Leptospira noguchii serovar Panama str. CZ214]
MERLAKQWSRGPSGGKVGIRCLRCAECKKRMRPAEFSRQSMFYRDILRVFNFIE